MNSQISKSRGTGRSCQKSSGRLIPGAVKMPFWAVMRSGSTPSSAAARSSRSRRSHAAACRNAAPLVSSDMDPAVMPSLGVLPVCAVSITTCSGSTSSSSATMSRSAVRTPWPISTLPVRATTRSGASTRTQSDSRGNARSPGGRFIVGPRQQRSQAPAECVDAPRSGTGAVRGPRGWRPRLGQGHCGTALRRQQRCPVGNSRIGPR